MDFNRTVLQGKIISSPRTRDLSSSTKLTFFQLSVEESWTSRGKRCSRNNRIPIEVVGRDAEMTARDGAVGRWVILEGYIRSEEYQGRTLLKVRTLNIQIWDNHGEMESSTRNSGSENAASASKRGTPPVTNPFTRG